MGGPVNALVAGGLDFLYLVPQRRGHSTCERVGLRAVTH